MGLFGNAFDLNEDGQMGVLEKAIEFEAFCKLEEARKTGNKPKLTLDEQLGLEKAGIIFGRDEFHLDD